MTAPSQPPSNPEAFAQQMRAIARYKLENVHL